VRRDAHRWSRAAVLLPVPVPRCRSVHELARRRRGARQRRVHPHRQRGRSQGLLETSVPGVYAAGDARAGSIKRCATAVGEGAAWSATCTSTSGARWSRRPEDVRGPPLGGPVPQREVRWLQDSRGFASRRKVHSDHVPSVSVCGLSWRRQRSSAVFQSRNAASSSFSRRAPGRPRPARPQRRSLRASARRRWCSHRSRAGAAGTDACRAWTDILEIVRNQLHELATGHRWDGQDRHHCSKYSSSSRLTRERAR